MDIKASTQALYYVSKKLKKPLDKWTGLKLVFFADRYHIRKYGRTITDDFYYAMEHGPVGSTTYDVLKFNTNTFHEKKYIEHFLEKEDDKCKAKNKNLKLDYLSETDIEALDFAINIFGKFSSKKIKNISHLYPEWNRFKKTLKTNSITRIEMNIIDFFNDPTSDEEFKQFSFEQDPFKCIPIKIVQSSKEIFLGHY